MTGYRLKSAFMRRNEEWELNYGVTRWKIWHGSTSIGNSHNIGIKNG